MSETIYSSFWIDEDVSSFNSLIDDQTSSLGNSDNLNDRLYYLSKVRECIKNLVCIYCGRDVDVQFKSNDMSYTNGETVVLSSKIHSGNLDSTVGLALHESSHILYSDFELIKQLIVKKNVSNILKSNKIPDRYYDRSKLIGYSESDVNNSIKNLLNWIEDRRIDMLSYIASPGFIGYYHALYKRYFFNQVISTALKSPMYRQETMQSYFYRIFNILNPCRDLNALKGLSKIYDVLDLENINRLLNTSDALTLALSIYDIMLDNIDITKDQSKPDEYQEGDGEESDGDGDDSDDGEDWDPDADIVLSKDGKSGKPIPWDKLSDKQKEQVKKQIADMIEDQKDFTSSNSGDSKIPMSTADAEKVDIMSETNCTLVDVNSNISTTPYRDIYDNKIYEVIVIKNMKEGNFFSSDFPFRSSIPEYREKVLEGIKLGKILANKLRIRNEERPLEYTRLNSGRIDKRRLSSLVGFNSNNVFKQVFVEKYCDSILHISLDISGSMGSVEKLGNALMMITSICYAADIIKNMNVVVSVRGSHELSGRRLNSTYTQLPLVAIIYDSRTDKISKVKNIFPFISTCGGTPEGLCFAAIQDLILSSTKMLKSYFCNFSDGEPFFSNYGGIPAAQHTAGEIKKMKLKGIKILSYFIGDKRSDNGSKRLFSTMYGSDSKFIEPSDIISVARTLNSLFIDDKI
jgi:hypothetical protein